MIFYYSTPPKRKKNKSNNYIATIFNKIFTIISANGCVLAHYATVRVGIRLDIDNPQILEWTLFFPL